MKSFTQRFEKVGDDPNDPDKRTIYSSQETPRRCNAISLLKDLVGDDTQTLRVEFSEEQ